jgi:hypothetical protein
MKNFLIIFVSFVLTSNAEAQNLSDSSVYDIGLRKIESAKNLQDYIVAAKYFDDLTSIKYEEWLAPLYAGLSYILASFNESEGKLKDELCDKAQIYIDTANIRHADVSESAAVQAFLFFARIDVSPTERGMEYSLKADSEIKKAEAANPNDPRPYFLYAMNVYYTPKLFGGGAEKALPLFEKAADKFNEFILKMPFMPNWGKQQNIDMITKCKQEIEAKEIK